MRTFYHKEDLCMTGVVIGLVIVFILGLCVLPSRVSDSPEKAARRVMDAIYHKNASGLCNEINPDTLAPSAELMDPYKILENNRFNDELICLKAKQIDFDQMDAKQRLMQYQIRDVIPMSDDVYRVEIPITYFSEGMVEPDLLYLLIQEKDGRFWYLPN